MTNKLDSQIKRKIEIVPYDPNWAEMFEDEAKKIKEALGSNCIDVHHIGLTSVPGLAAKPLIYMLPVVKDITQVGKCQAAMEALGYDARGEFGIAFRRFFCKSRDTRTHNVHVFEEGDSEIERHLDFRDWMRNNPADLKAYAELKRNLAQKFPNDIYSYCSGKDQFINDIDAKAGFNGYRFVVAALPREIQAFKEIARSSLNTKDNIYNFVLYKAADIVAVAEVQFEAKLHAKINFIKCKDAIYHEVMESKINKWLAQYKIN